MPSPEELFRFEGVAVVCSVRDLGTWARAPIFVVNTTA